MFNNNSMLKNINIISKFISLLFVLFTIIFINNNYILVFIGILFVFLCNFNKFSLLSLIFSFFCFILDIHILVKFIYFIIYLLLFSKIVSFNEFRYFFEKLFYGYKNGFLCYFLKKYYYIKYYIFSFKELYRLKRSYGVKLGFSLIRFLIVESHSKTKTIVTNMLFNYKFRLYQMYSKKTYYNDYDKLDSYDYKYILVHVLLFFFVYVY